MINKKIFLGALVFFSGSLSFLRAERNPGIGARYMSMINRQLANHEDVDRFSAEILLTIEDDKALLKKIKEEYNSSKIKNLTDIQKKELESKFLADIKETFIKPRVEFLEYLYDFRIFLVHIAEWIFSDVLVKKFDPEKSILIKFMNTTFENGIKCKEYFLTELDTFKKATDTCLELLLFVDPFWKQLAPEIKRRSLIWIKAKNLRTDSEIQALAKGPYFEGVFVDVSNIVKGITPPANSGEVISISDVKS